MAAPTESDLVFYVELRDQDGGRWFEVGAAGILLGRAPSCDIVVPQRPLASRHAYFYRDGGACFVENLAPPGTLQVNGLDASQEGLSDGDIITAGGVELQCHVRQVEAVVVAELPAAAEEAPADVSEAASAAEVLPLGLAALVFGVLAYQHWAFAAGALLLGLITLYEAREKERAPTRSLAIGAIVIGLLGGLLNAWFTVGPGRPTRPGQPPSWLERVLPVDMIRPTGDPHDAATDSERGGP